MGSELNKTSRMQDDNLETHSIIWFDVQIDKTENHQRELRSIINHLKIFVDQNQCQQYISSLSSQDRLILIISRQDGRQLIPHIHQLRQLSSIYIYTADKQIDQQWIQHYSKVKDIFTRFDDLIDQIRSDLNQDMKLEEPLGLNMFTVADQPNQSTASLNSSFLHSLVLSDALLQMKSIQTDKHNLVSLLISEYKNNDAQLSNIRDFSNNYSAHKAVWWYTSDCFLNKIINKALQVQNFDLLFLLRFVINDIYRQLKQNQCQSPVRVYRGQLMTNDELDIFRQSKGNFLSNNSFLSANMCRKKVLKSLNNSSDLHRVLFVIDADPRLVQSKPFASIRYFSKSVDEYEVLFMIGCIFRLVDIHPDKYDDQIWIIQAELCGENDELLKTAFDSMKKLYGQFNLLSFGDILSDMNEYDLAEKIYHRLLTELSSNDPTLADLYYSLGLLNYNKKDYNSSLHWFKKSVKIKMKANPSNYIGIGNINHWIGRVYRMKGDFNKALKYCNKVLELYQQRRAERHPHLAGVYRDIADVYYKQSIYSEAFKFYEKSLYIYERQSSSDQSDVVDIHNAIGVVRSHLEQYTGAMECHHDALKIQLKSYSPKHPSLAKTYRYIGIVHEKKNELELALTYFRKAAAIYRLSLPSEHPDVIEIEKNIQHVL